jgi:hypothetical protein
MGGSPDGGHGRFTASSKKATEGDVMKVGYARERMTAKDSEAPKKASSIVVVLPDRVPPRGAGSPKQRGDDDLAGGIVRFSLGSGGH